MKCKTCDKKFAPCNNSYWENWLAHYCSETCWKNSTEYKINHNLVTTFIDTLGKEQFSMFRGIMELESDYEFMIEDIIEENATFSNKHGIIGKPWTIGSKKEKDR